MNLFLYIPAYSAHPPGVLNSLIYGLMKTYRLQNTKRTDYIKSVNLLYHRLIARGYTQSQLVPIFNSAESKLKQPLVSKFKNNIQHVKKSDTDKLFFHLEFHPRDISRQEIHRIYTKTCEQGYQPLSHLYNDEHDAWMNLPHVTVAYSRCKNLRDKLFPSTLFETDTIKVSNYTAQPNT